MKHDKPQEWLVRKKERFTARSDKRKNSGKHKTGQQGEGATRSRKPTKRRARPVTYRNT